MKAIIISLSLLLSSCATQSFVFDKKHYKSYAPTYTQIDSFFIGGIGQTTVTREVDQICTDKGKKIASVKFKQTASNIFFTAITLGIYSPRTMEVHCI